MRKNLFLIVIIILVILGGIYFFTKKEKGVVCTQDVKECSDGSFVSRVVSDCNFALCSKENLIQVETPQANEIIFSPLIVKGRARGFWFLEANFPIKLLDDDGNIIVQTIAQTKEEWMTEEFVLFEAEIQFSPLSTKKGVLVLENGNPSGLHENADELRIPIFFSSKGILKRPVKLFYYNPEQDRDETGKY